MLLCNIGPMRLIPNLIRRAASAFRPLVAGGIACLAVGIAGPSAGHAQTEGQSEAIEEPCEACGLISGLAERLNRKAERYASAARNAAATTSEARARLVVVADGVRLLADAARDAAARCSDEGVCRMPHPATPVSTGGAGEAERSAGACDGTVPEQRWTELLGPVNALAAAMGQDAQTCALLACPDAECGARAHMLEQAAFTDTLLSVLLGGDTAPTGDPDTEEASPIADLPRGGQAQPEPPMAAEVLAALSELPGSLTSSGLDAEKTQALAARLAALEARLTHDPADGGLVSGEAPGTGWRHLAARLALAGMRDALTTMRLGTNVHIPARWSQAAGKLRAALTAAMRLDRSAKTQAHAHGPAARACHLPSLDVQRVRVRLQAAMNRAASCSVRAGCPVDAAFDRGVSRARLLLDQPTGSRALEIARALGEEAPVSAEQAEAARAAEAPEPGIALSRDSFRTGEIIAISVTANGNRCLAGGGHVALLPYADVRGRSPFAVAGKLGTGRAEALTHRRHDGRSEDSQDFAAPAPGAYRAMVVAGEGAGGRRLASYPVQVSDGEPARCEGWTGVWQTEFGRLVTVAREDGSVTGTYRRRPDVWPGFLRGRIRNGQLVGAWHSEISGGGTRLTLRGDGVFRGSWGLSPASERDGGTWSGICIAPDTDEEAR
jgi:hypothetical protein